MIGLESGADDYLTKPFGVRSSWPARARSSVVPGSRRIERPRNPPRRRTPSSAFTASKSMLAREAREGGRDATWS